MEHTQSKYNNPEDLPGNIKNSGGYDNKKNTLLVK